jgi:hypothetical protein
MESINKPIEDKVLKPMFKTVAPQTIIAFWGYVLLLIAMVIALFVGKKPITTGVISTVVYVGVAILSLYVLNCTVVGSCHVYAWIMSYVIISIAVIFLIATAFKFTGK